MIFAEGINMTMINLINEENYNHEPKLDKSYFATADTYLTTSCNGSQNEV
jgi:hypothetical protein